MHCVCSVAQNLSYKDKFFGTGKKYDKDFTKRFGYAPPYQSAESSAALIVFKDAFEEQIHLMAIKLEMLYEQLKCKLSMEILNLDLADKILLNQ